MNSPTISINAKTAFDIQPSIFFDSNINAAADNNNPHASQVATKILKNGPRQFAAALAQEVRKPLVNINLSVEMLKSSVRDNDLEICLDVIMRSSIRITNLLNEFLKSQQVDEEQAKRPDHI